MCLVCGAVILPNVAELTHPRLDAASVALVGIALVGILYGVSTVFSENVIAACASAAVGVVALVLFVRRQGRLEEPRIDLRPLKVPAFSVGVVANMLSLVTIFAMNIIVPTFMQSVLGTPPLIASLTLFPAILCSCAASPLAGRIYDRRGPGVLLPAGFACIAVFSVLTAALIATASPVALALLYIPVICGSALVIGPVQSFALSKLPPELNPHGVTVMSTGFQIAGCIGSSVFVGVYSLVGAGVAADGMLASGALVGACAAVGFALALWIGRNAKSPVVAKRAARGGESAAQATLASVMKTDVFTVSPETSVAAAMRLFAEKGISGAPVVDAEGRVAGFVSDGDIMASLADQVPAFKSAWSFVVECDNDDFGATVRSALALPVGAIATKRVISVDVEDDLGEVARVLAERHLKKAPVLDGGVMVGVINRSNIAKYALESYFSDEG